MDKKELKFRIYKLKPKSGGKCYIGSTKKPLNIRLIEHKSSYKVYEKNRSSSYKLFEEYGVNEIEIEELAVYENIDKKELRKYELDFLLKESGNTVNIRNPFFVKELYREKQKIWSKNWYNKNKEKKKLSMVNTEQI
jgi:hypothetical protein